METSDLKKRAHALAAARKRLGISQVELALRAGCSHVTVSLLERGATMTPEMATRLAEALGVDARELCPDAIPASGPASANRAV